jgi:glucokinase
MKGQQGQMRLVVGLKIGPNRILSGIFGPELRCVKTLKRSTKLERGPVAVLERIVRCVQDVADEADATVADVGAVGVAVPGLVAADQLRVVDCPRLGWGDFPLGESLRDRLAIPVVVENDCNLATLGAWAVEHEGKPGRMLGIFVGGQIGGGWVVHARLCGGFAESVGQLGHRVLDPHGPLCRCGNRGCFDSLASRQAVFSRIEAAIASGRQTQLTEALAKVGRLRIKDLRQAFRSGDPLVKEAVAAASHWIGVAIGALVRDLSPDVVVLGGGMIEALREEMLSTVAQAVAEHGADGALDRVRIVASSMGDEASIAGAAWLAGRLLPGCSPSTSNSAEPCLAYSVPGIPIT